MSKGSHGATWPLNSRPGFLIRRLHQIHVALFMQACSGFDITPVQYSLLSALAQRGQADQTTLAADVVLDRTTTAGALRRMEMRNLIRRTVLVTDRRVMLCTCTDAGLSLLEAMEGAARSSHDETVAALDPTEQQQLMRLLRRLVAANPIRPA